MQKDNKNQFLRKRLHLNDLPVDLKEIIFKECDYKNPKYNPKLNTVFWDFLFEESSKMDQALNFSRKNMKHKRDESLRKSKRKRIIINAIEKFIEKKGLSIYNRSLNEY